MSRPKAPRLIFWEITQRCNFACPLCRRPGPGHGELDSEKSLSILKQLAGWPGARVIFTGGEPTLREDLPLLVSSASRMGLVPLLATNAALMTKALAECLRQSGIAHSSVSLLGSSAKRHDAISGLEGSFEKALKGIQTLQTSGISVQVNHVVTSQSKRDLAEMMAVAQRVGAVALHLFLFVPTGRGCGFASEANVDPRDMMKVFETAHRMSRAPGLSVRFTCCPQFAVYLARLGSSSSESAAGCGAGKNVLFISSEGKAYPCGYLPLEAGDLLREDVQRIWEGSELLNRLADPDALRGACGECAHRRLCGGCRARAHGASGDVLGSDPACPYAGECRP